MTQLSDMEPMWIREGIYDRHQVQVHQLDATEEDPTEAQGFTFTNPQGRAVYVWFADRGVVRDEPKRAFTGDSFDNLTVEGAISIGAQWIPWSCTITDGEVEEA